MNDVRRTHPVTNQQLSESDAHVFRGERNDCCNLEQSRAPWDDHKSELDSTFIS